MSKFYVQLIALLVVPVVLIAPGRVFAAEKSPAVSAKIDKRVCLQTAKKQFVDGLSQAQQKFLTTTRAARTTLKADLGRANDVAQKKSALSNYQTALKNATRTHEAEKKQLVKQRDSAKHAC